MTDTTDHLPPIGAILTGPQWPSRVCVVRVEPHGASRVLIVAVTLDEQAHLMPRLFRRDDLANLGIRGRRQPPHPDWRSLGFKLAAEATRIRLAYTYDPLFAVSVARIDPLPTSSKPSTAICCASRGCASCWPTTASAGCWRDSWPAASRCRRCRGRRGYCEPYRLDMMA